MKTTTRIIAAVAATAAVALAGAAFAHGDGPGFGGGWGPRMGPGMGMGAGMGPGMGMGMGPGMGRGSGMGAGFGGFDMSAAAAGRLAALKTQLKITPAQEAAWKAYEAVVTQQAADMQARREQLHAQWQDRKPGEPAPDMAAHRQAMVALHEAQANAMKELYAVLTPEQQQVANGGWGRGPRGTSRR